MILERLKIIIDNQFFFGKEITPEVRLIEDLGADSFDSLVLVNSIEEVCHENLASFKCPRSFKIVEGLPKNSSGKIDKKQIKEARDLGLL